MRLATATELLGLRPESSRIACGDFMPGDEPPNQTPEPNRDKSLGVIAVPDSTVEHDFDIQSRYQDFTSEILRLSLLGISAVGYIVLKYLFPDKEPSTNVPDEARTPFVIALIAFGLASVASLLHRYVSVDSLSWHLQAIRKELRGASGDASSAKEDRKRRYSRFLISRYAVIAAAGSLGVGACTLAYAFYTLIRK